MPTPIVWLEPTDTAQVRLRVYSAQLVRPCMHDEPWGHDAKSDVVAVVPLVRSEHGTYPHEYPQASDYDGHAAWPAQCANPGCEYLFQTDDLRQVIQEELYRRSDTGECTTLPAAPVGSAWDAQWRQPQLAYGDGINCLYVRVPGGLDWCVDAQSSNCTRPGQPHHCWVRHGDPRQPHTLHVDKQGDTCQAGAGSIISGRPGTRSYWHGFLHNGALTDHIG